MCGRKKTRAHESVESNKLVKSSEHLKSSELVKSSMMIMMMMNDGDDDDARPLSCKMSESIELLTHVAAAMKTPRCGMPESKEVYAQIGPASKTRKCAMSESIELLTHIAAEMKTPRCGMPESINSMHRSAQHQRPENAQCQNLQNC